MKLLFLSCLDFIPSVSVSICEHERERRRNRDDCGRVGDVPTEESTAQRPVNQAKETPTIRPN